MQFFGMFSLDKESRLCYKHTNQVGKSMTDLSLQKK